jgi:hypothetical protein
MNELYVTNVSKSQRPSFFTDTVESKRQSINLMNENILLKRKETLNVKSSLFKKNKQKVDKLRGLFYYDPAPKSNGYRLSKDITLTSKRASDCNLENMYKQTIPTLVINKAKDLADNLKSNIIIDPYKLSIMNTHFETQGELNGISREHARKSHTLEDSSEHTSQRPILIDSRTQSIFNMDGITPHRKNTVQFDGSYYQSHRNSTVKPTASRLSISQQKSFSKRIRQNSVFRKDSVFMIQDEDKIFDDERFKTSVEWVKSLQKEKSQLKLNKTDQNYFRSIYKTSHEGLKRLTKAKKMKNLDLERYQRNLINKVGDFLSKEAVRKLESKLQYVKNMANQVQKEEAIELLFSQISEQNEVTLKNLQDSVEKLNHISEVIKLGSAKLPVIKMKV